jgi:hypothetical protein
MPCFSIWDRCGGNCWWPNRHRREGSPNHILFGPLPLVEARKDGSVQHAWHDVARLTEPLEPIGDEVVVVGTGRSRADLGFISCQPGVPQQ